MAEAAPDQTISDSRSLHNLLLQEVEMADTIEPKPADATPEDENTGKLAERGPQQYLSEEEVAELEARIRESGRRSAPPASR